MTDVVTFDPQAFQKKVKEHIVNSFGSMLPEDHFAALVDKQIKEFFDTEVQLTFKETVTSGWGRGQEMQMATMMTPFKQMVWTELTKLVKARLDIYMKSDNVTHPVNKLLDELFKVPEFEDHQVLTAQKLMLEMAGQFFSAHLSAAGYNAKMNIANALQQSGMPEVANKIWNS